MSTERIRSKEALATETWRMLAEIFIRTAWSRHAALRKLGLTPNEARAIQTLPTTDGRPMRALADSWACDASNATWIVDRLERQNLAERRPSPSDRRVKLVVLTRKGARVRDRLRAEMMQPPDEILELDEPDLEAMRSALVKLTGKLSGSWFQKETDC